METHLQKLKGVIVPVATPVDSAGDPDLAALRRLLSFLLVHSLDGLFANGSMGGFAHLTDASQYQIIETITAYPRGVPVVAGVSDTSISRVRQKIAVIQTMPVAALVLLPPYYYMCRQDELIRFFLLAADFAQKPIILYDNPRYTQNALEPATIAGLARHPNIHGIKISAPDVLKWEQVLEHELPRDRFSLVCGAEKLMDVALGMGFDGITGGLHNITPGLAVQLYRAASSGDAATASRLQAQLNRIYQVFEADGGWRGLEVAFAALSMPARFAPPPHDIPVPEEKKRGILEILESENVLAANPA